MNCYLRTTFIAFICRLFIIYYHYIYFSLDLFFIYTSIAFNHHLFIALPLFTAYRVPDNRPRSSENNELRAILGFFFSKNLDSKFIFDDHISETAAIQVFHSPHTTPQLRPPLTRNKGFEKVP